MSRPWGNPVGRYRDRPNHGDGQEHERRERHSPAGASSERAHRLRGPVARAPSSTISDPEDLLLLGVELLLRERTAVQQALGLAQPRHVTD